MQSNELETIAATIQDALHRAYALGRSDALRRVVEMVQADELGSKTVALLEHSAPPVEEAPQLEAPAPAPEIEADAAPANAAPVDAAHNDNAERPGTAEREQHQAASPPASIKDFLLDYLYPLGAKK